MKIGWNLGKPGVIEQDMDRHKVISLSSSCLLDLVIGSSNLNRNCQAATFFEVTELTMVANSGPYKNKPTTRFKIYAYNFYHIDWKINQKIHSTANCDKLTRKLDCNYLKRGTSNKKSINVSLFSKFCTIASVHWTWNPWSSFL